MGMITLSITIRDVAKKAGVSSATVSRVLNQSDTVTARTKEHVLQVIQEMGYFPSQVARSLSKSETRTIGVVVPDINNPFYGEVIKGISQVADKNDLNILLCDTDENLQREKKSLFMLKEHRIRGIIIAPISDTDDSSSEYLTLLENLGIPIVLLGRDVKHSTFDGVFIDNVRGAFDGVNAFIEEGHADIAIIAFSQSTNTGRDRLIGYKKAMALHNLPVLEQSIYFSDSNNIYSSYNITREILRRPDRPTAIFACNNIITLGCIKALAEAGLSIPRDMALIGFDEIQILNILNMQISMIARPTYDMGKEAMRILLKRLQSVERGFKTAERVIMMPKLLSYGSERFCP